jgi:hypothetical protein
MPCLHVQTMNWLQKRRHTVPIVGRQLVWMVVSSLTSSWVKIFVFLQIMCVIEEWILVISFEYYVYCTYREKCILKKAVRGWRGRGKFKIFLREPRKR